MLLTYETMCAREGMQSLQRGMHYRRRGPAIVLMTRKKSAVYTDAFASAYNSVEYTGHDAPHGSALDQAARTPSGALTTNGRFIRAIERYQNDGERALRVRVYEKIRQGVWRYRGLHRLVSYRVVKENNRAVFKFRLVPLARTRSSAKAKTKRIAIPSSVKQAVYLRDGGRCAICGSAKELHFDHIIPLAKGGAARSVDNLQLLCAKHNLKKAASIE